MSGTEDDPLLLAGEYVLGSLDLAEMREAEALAARDPAFAREIAFWQDRLAALGDLVPPVAPPPVLWSRLALAIGLAPAPRRSAGAFWKGTTAVFGAIAAGLALFAFLPRPPSPGAETARFAAALGPLASPAQFLVESRPDGSLALTNLGANSAPAGRDYQLWAVPQGATVPISLGVIRPGSSVLTPSQRASAQEQLLVSEEPAGGSATGAPTGPVLFGGKLTSVSPAATPGR